MGLSLVNPKIWLAIAFVWALAIAIRALRAWWSKVKSEYQSGLGGS